MIDTRNATKDEMLLCHSEEYLDQIKKMADMEPDQRKEECLTKFHSVYMNEKSYECAELAAGSAIELTKAILDGEIQNGLALLRPPGKGVSVQGPLITDGRNSSKWTGPTIGLSKTLKIVKIYKQKF